MKQAKSLSMLLILLLVAALVLAACGGDEDKGDDATPEDAVTESSTAQDDASDAYAGKKVLFIDSYNTDYEHSKKLTDTVTNGLAGTGAELQAVHMDAKNNPDTAYVESKAAEIKAAIDEFNPDVIIACDDIAQQYVIVPYVRDTGTPVVFCGVNWDPEPYGYPTENVTGIVEVDLVGALTSQLENYAAGSRVGIISADTITERRTAAAYQDRFFNGEMKEYWAATYEQFTELFMQAQTEVDVLLFINDAGIRNWDAAAAEQFLLENTTIPTGSVYAWMTDYVLMDLAKQPEEMAEWAVEAALQILDGTSPADIAMSENSMGDLFINLSIAEQLDIAFEPNVLRNATVVE